MSSWRERAMHAYHERTEELRGGAGRNGTVSADGWRDDQRGDAYEGPRHEPRPPTPEYAGDQTLHAAPHFKLITSADFVAADYRLDWLVRRLLVQGQPAVLGGPKKSLKTSLLVDLALSLGTGTRFLGEFEVARPVRVALLSGESGEPTLRETALRVALAKGVDLAAADVLWGFDLPQLADVTQVAALQEALEEAGAEVLLLDPLYLSLLAGVERGGPQASNLFQIGPLLMGVARACAAIGVTPVFAHHFKLTRADHYGEPQLEDLAFAGIQEFARQWLLVGRREQYRPGTGEHRLLLSAGGSAGQSGLWALDIDEGTIGEDFTGRTWAVTLTTAAEAREATRAVREQANKEGQARRDHEDEQALLAALDELDPDGHGAVANRVRVLSGLSRDRFQRTADRLRTAGVVEAVEVAAGVGNGARRASQGIRRRRE